MATIWGQRRGEFIVPYAKFAETVRELPEGARLRVKVDTDRNGKFSALYHVMLGLIVKAVNAGPASTTIDDLKKWVKLKRGWYSVIPLPNPTKEGVEVAIEYQSTAFAKMGEEEFHRFAVDTCNLIASEMMWCRDAPEWDEAMKIVATIAPDARETA
jgi:hypothetical protein